MNIIKKYNITLKHDNGKFKTLTTIISDNDNEEEDTKKAIKMVCDMEKAPENAVIKIKLIEKIYV